MDPEIFAIISSNIRIADQRIGDIKAQAAALLVGEKRLMELVARYGRETLDEAIGQIRARSAERMRAEIRAIPDGTYSAESFVDSDGVVNAPLRIALDLTKAGEMLAAAFAEAMPLTYSPRQRARDEGALVREHLPLVRRLAWHRFASGSATAPACT